MLRYALITGASISTLPLCPHTLAAGSIVYVDNSAAIRILPWASPIMQSHMVRLYINLSDFVDYILLFVKKVSADLAKQASVQQTSSIPAASKVG